MKKIRIDYFVTAIGVLLLVTGLFLLKLSTNTHGIMIVLPYVCIGVGCGSLGHGLGNIINYKALKKRPKINKQIEIEKNDERNIAISNRARAKAYDIMVYVFGALMISFTLMGVELMVILLLVFTYLFVIGCGIIYHSKYEKNM